MPHSLLVESPAWRALSAHATTLRDRRMGRMFEDDPQRAERFSLDAPGLVLDYSKQKVTAETLQLLGALSQRQGLGDWIVKLFSGEHVNHTEDRAALHMALRMPREAALQVDGVDVVAQVHEVLDRMDAFALRVRQGQWLGATGQTIRDVVNIGIGGSDLGPRMVCEALAGSIDGPTPHFVANVDGAQLHAVLGGLDPARTLFVVTSKTFTTQETMANARNARVWLASALGEAAVNRHFVAVSTNAAAVAAFGIPPEQMFGFWDWVGGRYSVWSAVGLSCVLALGPERFRALLAGAHAMDLHFRDTPPERNLPVLLGWLAVWNSSFLGSHSQVIAPYAQALERFVGWLQQLEMESNGKGVRRDGQRASLSTTPVLWGDVGTNAQHAFFQMLHQGPDIHPVDFIAVVEAAHPFADQHRLLLANCLAQGAALMRGKTAAEVREELTGRYPPEQLDAQVPHRVFTGNRPSNTLLLQRLDPWHLGALMAAYEHRTFVMSVLWDINPFDQWGVELGKRLAGEVLAALEGRPATLDPSTALLVQRLR